MYRLGSVAAPVLDPQGFARAAISITGSIDGLGEGADRQVRLVVAAARRTLKPSREGPCCPGRRANGRHSAKFCDKCSTSGTAVARTASGT